MEMGIEMTRAKVIETENKTAEPASCNEGDTR